MVFNRNAIHLVRTIYDQQIMAAIAVSVVPEGRDAEAEITKLADMYRQGESATGRSFGVGRLTTGFGPTLGLKMKDIAPESRNGPFPLNIGAFYNPAKQPIESLSVHRVFVRGPDRIEVAVFQMAPQPAAEETEADDAPSDRLGGQVGRIFAILYIDNSRANTAVKFLRGSAG